MPVVEFEFANELTELIGSEPSGGSFSPSAKETTSFFILRIPCALWTCGSYCLLKLTPGSAMTV